MINFINAVYHPTVDPRTGRDTPISSLESRPEPVECAGCLPRGKTAAKVSIERKTGRHIMKQRLSNWFFRTTNEDKHVLCKKSITPRRYTLDGRFMF